MATNPNQNTQICGFFYFWLFFLLCVKKYTHFCWLIVIFINYLHNLILCFIVHLHNHLLLVSNFLLSILLVLNIPIAIINLDNSITFVLLDLHHFHQVNLVSHQSDHFRNLPLPMYLILPAPLTHVLNHIQHHLLLHYLAGNLLLFVNVKIWKCLKRSKVLLSDSSSPSLCVCYPFVWANSFVKYDLYWFYLGKIKHYQKGGGGEGSMKKKKKVNTISVDRLSFS